jgi:hypothetical protein
MKTEMVVIKESARRKRERKIREATIGKKTEAKTL